MKNNRGIEGTPSVIEDIKSNAIDLNVNYRAEIFTCAYLYSIVIYYNSLLAGALR